MTGLEFNERLRDIPVYPAASTYAFDGELVKLASNETPFGPHPQVLEAVEAQLRTLNRYPDPEQDRAAHAASPSAPACPPGASPSATARASSCSPRPRRCSSRAPRSSTPGRRSRCIRSWRRCRAPAPSTVPLNDAGEHDLDAMAREVTAATRIVIVCNPNNPTATALPPAAIDEFVGELPAPRGRDPRRGVRGVLVAPGPRRVARPARAPPQPDPAAHLLEGLRPLRPAGRLRARLGGLPARGRPRAPAVLRERARPGRRGRGAQPPGRGRAARGADGDRAHARGVGARTSAASRPPTARRTSPGSRSATATRTRWSTGSPSAA